MKCAIYDYKVIVKTSYRVPGKILKESCSWQHRRCTIKRTKHAQTHAHAHHDPMYGFNLGHLFVGAKYIFGVIGAMTYTESINGCKWYRDHICLNPCITEHISVHHRAQSRTPQSTIPCITEHTWVSFHVAVVIYRLSHFSSYITFIEMSPIYPYAFVVAIADLIYDPLDWITIYELEFALDRQADRKSD